MEPRVRLVALWGIDVGFQLKSLDLACTRAWNADRGRIECYWRYSFTRTELLGNRASDEFERPVPSLLDDLDLPPRRVDRSAHQG